MVWSEVNRSDYDDREEDFEIVDELSSSSKGIPSFDFGSLLANLGPEASASEAETAFDPPASNALPLASSANVSISELKTQESIPNHANLKPVSLRIQNPFANLDFSFPNCIFSASASSSLDPLKNAKDTVGTMVNSPPSTWSADQFESIMKSFDILVAHAINTEMKTNIKVLKAKLNRMWSKYVAKKERDAVLTEGVKAQASYFADYNGWFELVEEESVADTRRLNTLKARQARMKKLESELPMERTKNLFFSAEQR